MIAIRRQGSGFCELKEAIDGGNRAVLVIAGNHDNPGKAYCCLPLASSKGL